ncbi:MAG: dockerin type I repeat-containing protein [Oscillospiraceae bacterium]|nr:dockerin type I repeat-containing protein [Oscillospiraceae bacterium]
MKHAKRIIALLIACLMFGSTAAMAADAAEDLSLGTPDVNDVLSAEDYSRIYDKTQYDMVFNTEYINVYLKKGVNHLPDYSVDEYKVGNSEVIPVVFGGDGNETERIMVRGVVLKEYRSRENILAIIEKMKDDPYVYYVEPDYKLRPSVAGSTAPFETDAYIGDPDYNDLLYEGEYRRLIGRIEPAFAYYTGNLKISFKVGVDVSESFGTVFSDLNVESVQINKEAHMETNESGEKVSVTRQVALVTLTDASLEHAYNVSVSLMNHPLVHSAKPEFIDSYCGGGTEPQPDPVSDYAFTEAELAKIYDPANYEKGDYMVGQVIVGLTKKLPAGTTYKNLFPDYTVNEKATKEYAAIDVVCYQLPERTKSAVVEAIGVLKDNPYVIYAEPHYIYQVRQTLIADTPLAEPAGEHTLSEEELAKIYDPRNYSEREYVPGELQISFKKPISGVRTYEELFPELEIDEVIRVFNFKTSSFVQLSLKEKTKTAVLRAIEILKQRADIAYVEPNYLTGFFMSGVEKGDVDENGEVENVDLILTAKNVVELVEFTEAEKYSADMNGDGEVTNADVITVARLIVGLIPDDMPVSTDYTAEEISSMIEAYRSGYGSDVEEMYSFGKYGSCDVLYVVPYNLESYAAREDTFEIAGCKFAFSKSILTIAVYDGSRIRRIDLAYKAGLLTDEDVADIWEKYTEMDMVKIPTPVLPKLTEERAREINQAYTDKMGTGISSMKYYGKVSGCEALFIRGRGGAAAVVVQAEAAGFWFNFPDPGAQMYIFKGSDFLRIDEAYEAGWITAEDVEAVWLQGRATNSYRFEVIDGETVRIDYAVSYFNGTAW